MKPRLTSSNKWTVFPPEYIEQIQEIYKTSFAVRVPKASWHAEGRIYPKEILLRAGFVEAGRLKAINFEASMEYDTAKGNVKEDIHFCIDSIATLFEEYFENPDADFPRQWTAFELNKKTIFLQYTTVNPKLEAEADKLLGEDKFGLVNDDESDETASKTFH